MIDRSLLAHEKREKFLKEKASKKPADALFLVWVLSKDGVVFGSAIYNMWLGFNGITSGEHKGLLWWPQEDPTSWR